jgi:hypothetical protein
VAGEAAEVRVWPAFGLVLDCHHRPLKFGLTGGAGQDLAVLKGRGVLWQHKAVERLASPAVSAVAFAASFFRVFVRPVRPTALALKVKVVSAKAVTASAAVRVGVALVTVMDGVLVLKKCGSALWASGRCCKAHIVFPFVLVSLFRSHYGYSLNQSVRFVKNFLQLNCLDY